MSQREVDEHNGKEAYRLYQETLHRKWDERMWTKMNKQKRHAWSVMARKMIEHIQGE